MNYNKFTPLFCDLYQLTMAQAMFDKNTHEKIETYEMYIRKNPFNGGYLVAAGLGELLQWIDGWKFEPEHIDYLRSLQGTKFKPEFLNMLAGAKLTVNVDAFPEGEIVFPNEPIVRVTGPAWQCMMLETGILNIINAQSLIATKAARIRLAADAGGIKRKVMEFGLRRAQAVQGFMSTRAAFIGGFDATSNVEAGMHYGIPVAGTMAHCLIMRAEDERDAFKNYLQSFPENGTLLIDTYDTLEGAKKAVQASKETGIRLRGVRLDSGDLAYLSKEVRKILDAGGCAHAAITASNDLDEHTIHDLVTAQQAPIDGFGVGTMAVTAFDQPALGGVYKLKQTDGRDTIKCSENPIKTTIPGPTEIVRMLDGAGRYDGDVICRQGDGPIRDGRLTRDLVSINAVNERPKVFRQGTPAFYPMVTAVTNGRINPLMRDRKLVDIRAQTLQSLAKMDAAHLRFISPHMYVAGLEYTLYENRQNLLAYVRRQAIENLRQYT